MPREKKSSHKKQNTISITMNKGQIKALLAEALAAQNNSDWEKAERIYTQVLEHIPDAIPDKSTLKTKYDLLDKRANCFRHLANRTREGSDLETMLQMAEQLGDVTRQVMVINDQVMRLNLLNQPDKAKPLAEKALSLSRMLKDKKLIAHSLTLLGRITGFLQNNPSQGSELFDEALGLYQECDDPSGKADCLRAKASLILRSGQLTQARIYIQQSLEIFRQVGDREGEANALNLIGQTYLDNAQRRDYLDLAKIKAEETGHRPLLTNIYNGLSLVYLNLGLYNRACDYGRRTIEMARQSQNLNDLAYFLESLGRAYLEAGSYEAARPYLLEGLEMARETGERWVDPIYYLGLGKVALKTNNLSEARGYLQKSVQLLGDVKSPEQGTSLAWLGAVCLAEGDFSGALQYTGEAVSLLTSAENYSQEFPLQEIWWQRYLAEKKAGVPADKIWDTLDQARNTMFAGIASLSDEGLRRNYLNKVFINRQIVSEWLKEAARRGADLTPFSLQLAGKGDLQSQLKRMLETGVRLNARHEASNLPNFIMEEVVELTGSERAMLIMMDSAGKRQVAAVSLPRDAGAEQQAILRKEIEPLLDEVAQKRTPILRFIPQDKPELEQLSILCVPLIAQGKLSGMLYTDLSGIFGRFTNQDRDLLNILANQAAVAVENANWAGTLEKRVAQRTVELEAANNALAQRADELSVINSVQQGLASKLEYQAIIDLVGDKLLEVFKTQDIGIRLYDPKRNLINYSYETEHGQRLSLEPREPMGFSKLVLNTKKPVVINENMTKVSQEIGSFTLPVRAWE